MPFTPSGIPYDQHFSFNGGLGYGETFSRDANAFSAMLGCHWDDAEDFRREMLGYSEYDPTITTYLKRTPGQICPYSESAYAHTMEMTYYGRRPTDDNTADFDSDAATYNAIQGIHSGSGTPAYYRDDMTIQWFKSQYANYKVSFARLPYIIVSDAVLIGANGTAAGTELARYVTRQRTNNVRELRTPDYNFQPAGDAAHPIKVNGFIPTVEAELVYTWYQVPFAQIPRTAIKKNRLKINSADFDGGMIFDADGFFYPRPAIKAGTLLFIDAKGIDLPYQGADGGYYADIQYIFRLKEVYDGSGNLQGHNYFLTAGGVWVLAERRAPAPAGQYLYATDASVSQDFNNLFTPGT